jgi:hypothetical protein
VSEQLAVDVDEADDLDEWITDDSDNPHKKVHADPTGRDWSADHGGLDEVDDD